MCLSLLQMFLLPGGTLHKSSEWTNKEHSRITVAFNLAHSPKPGFKWEMLLNETEVADLIAQRERNIGNVLPDASRAEWAFITSRPKDRYDAWMFGLGHQE